MAKCRSFLYFSTRVFKVSKGRTGRQKEIVAMGIVALTTVLILSLLIRNGLLVRVLYLQRSSVPSAESWARMLTPFPELNDFSVCYRIRLHRFREESTLMSYAVSNSKDNELRMGNYQLFNIIIL